MSLRKIFAVLILMAGAALLTVISEARAAGDLRLAPELSFTDDSSANFPITGTDLKETAGPQDRATIIFFGTAHCWNTNREAERLVALYPKYRERINFAVVDLNAIGASQRDLVTRYYHGFIPTIAVIDSHGRVIYDRAGETAVSRGDASNLDALLHSAR